MKWVGFAENEPYPEEARDLICRMAVMVVERAASVGVSIAVDQLVIRRLANGNIAVYAEGYSDVSDIDWNAEAKGLVI